MAQDRPETLDPALLDDVYESSIVNQIFDGLLEFDSNLRTIPRIAESWKISRDGLVYTFHLRADLRFHDGSELTSEDVLYSFTRVFDLPEQQSILAREFLSHIEGTQQYASRESDSISGLVAPDAQTFEVKLKDPFGSFLAVVASDPIRVVPKAYVEAVGNQEFGRHPVGSGPFRVSRWDGDSRLILTAFEDYVPRARLDSLVFSFPDHNLRDMAAADFLRSSLSATVVPEGRLAEFRQLGGSDVVTRQELSLTFLGFNHLMPPFDDVRVRRAFSMAIDRREFLASGMARFAPNGILPPGMPGYSPENKLLPYDPEAARALLVEAGYPSGKGLGPIVLTSASQSEQGRALIQSVIEQVARVGFEIREQRLGWLEFSRRLTTRELQCFNVTWVADIPDPDSFLYPMGHSDGSANFTGYQNQHVERLLIQGRASRNEKERMSIYREIERLILQDAPLVPLFHPLSAIAVREGIRGVKVTPIGVGNIAMENIFYVTKD